MANELHTAKKEKNLIESIMPSSGKYSHLTAEQIREAVHSKNFSAQ